LHTPKYWFTLTEIIVVITLVAIIFLATKTWFQIDKTNNIQAQSCLYYSYWQIEYRLYAGLTYKNIGSGASTAPKTYTITIDPEQQHIILSYNQQDITTIEINNNKNIWCKNNDYQVVITGDKQTITIQNKTMVAANFTGNANFLICKENMCQWLGTIYYDTRSQQLYLYLCPQWEEGFCS
jgi:prepilin-type N-terminal cleavage/methylation domain-containing protein